MDRTTEHTETKARASMEHKSHAWIKVKNEDYFIAEAKSIVERTSSMLNVQSETI